MFSHVFPVASHHFQTVVKEELWILSLAMDGQIVDAKQFRMCCPTFVYNGKYSYPGLSLCCLEIPNEYITMLLLFF